MPSVARNASMAVHPNVRPRGGTRVPLTVRVWPAQTPVVLVLALHAFVAVFRTCSDDVRTSAMCCCARTGEMGGARGSPSSRTVLSGRGGACAGALVAGLLRSSSL